MVIEFLKRLFTQTQKFEEKVVKIRIFDESLMEFINFRFFWEMFKDGEVLTRLYFLFKVKTNFQRFAKPSQKVTNGCVWTFKQFDIE